jgi:CxxC-x17-CxxC domain-containing protein
MGDFRKSSSKRFGSHGGGFGRRDGSQGGFGQDRDRGPVTMHQAVCNQCGKPCEVPFRPTGSKPVYCNACFGGKKEIGNNRGADRFSHKPDFRSDTGRGNNDEVKKQLEILNEKMDRLIKAVEAMADTES